MLLGVPGLSRHDPRRSRALGAQHRARRWAELPAVPAGAGAARAGVLGVLVVGVATPTRAPSACTPGARRSGWRRSSRSSGPSSPRSRRDGLTPAEVVRAQGNLRGGLVLGLEDTPSRMNRIGRSELDYGHQRTVTDSLDRIAAVTPADVAALARELLTQPFTAAVVGPFDDEAALPGACAERRPPRTRGAVARTRSVRGRGGHDARVNVSIVVAAVLIVIGLVGVVVPVLPGPAARRGRHRRVGRPPRRRAGVDHAGHRRRDRRRGHGRQVPAARQEAEGGRGPGAHVGAGAVLGIVGFFVVPIVGLFLGFVLGVYLASTCA